MDPNRPLTITQEQVRGLLRDQFPEFLDEPLTPLDEAGTDNHIFRLGADKCVRMPKVDWAKDTSAREVGVLSKLSRMPLAVPQVIGSGAPGHGYPWRWSILSWLEGDELGMNSLGDPVAEAECLADFLLRLRHLPIDIAFSAGAANNYRGISLSKRSVRFNTALQSLEELYDVVAMKKAWANCLAGERKVTTSVWLHGDIHPGNVLAQRGRLSAVIDWGLAGVGDGACDLLSAWAIFDKAARDAFRRAMSASDAEWLRGAGWALSMAVIFIPYAKQQGLPYDMSERMLARVLEDFA